METHVKQGINEECYMPSPKLKAFLEQRLQYEQNKRAGKAQENAAGPDSRMLNYNLNKFVFPAMANLLYFLEQVAKYKELRSVFDAEIAELFGLIETAEVKRKGHNPAIRRLLEAMAAAGDGINGSDDFRLHVVEELARTATNCISSTAVRQMNNVDAGHLVGADGHRAWSWAQMQAQTYKIPEKVPKRPIRF